MSFNNCIGWYCCVENSCLIFANYIITIVTWVVIELFVQKWAIFWMNHQRHSHIWCLQMIYSERTHYFLVDWVFEQSTAYYQAEPFDSQDGYCHINRTESEGISTSSHMGRNLVDETEGKPLFYSWRVDFAFSSVHDVHERRSTYLWRSTAL